LVSRVGIKPRRLTSLTISLRLVRRVSYVTYRLDSSRSAIRFSGSVVKDESVQSLEAILE
jgi:hypothetical protein